MTTTHSTRKVTTSTRKQKIGKTASQKRRMAIAQREVTRLSPDQHQARYADAGFEEDEEDDWDPADDSEDEGAEDSDQDDRDDDEPGDDSADSDWLGLSVTLKEQYAATPVLELRPIFVLRVQPTDQSGWCCRFMLPEWLSRVLLRGGPAEDRWRSVTTFLRALAAWFETGKAAFLADPSPHCFVENEQDFNAPPVVTQQGLLARINSTAPLDKGWFPLDKGWFSELARNIWLVWPDKSMPLLSLFEREFHIAWVVRGCLGALPAKRRVFELPAPGELKKMKEALSDKSVSGLDPGERLLFLCQQVGLAAQEGLKAVEPAQKAVLEKADGG